MATSFQIVEASSPDDIAAVAELFLEYTSNLGIDLAYQSFDQELTSLPGKYAPANGGALFLARFSDGSNNKPAGCVALRPLPSAENPQRCELKRLYVRAETRGTGLGETLARKALETAVDRGYTDMVMDTLKSMTPARRLYAKLGFEEIEAYYETPISETVFYQRKLA